jgi:hypothetical protein
MAKYITLFLTTLSFYSPALFAGDDHSYKESNQDFYIYLVESIGESERILLRYVNDTQTFGRDKVDMVIKMKSRIETLKEVLDVYLFSEDPCK